MIKKILKRIHNKISAELENIIIKLRKTTNFGPLRLKYVFKLKCSVKTIYRVLKNNNLIKEREKNTRGGGI